jgi:gliding motility-associated-like protein
MTQFKKNYLYLFLVFLFVSFNIKAQVTANFSGSVTSGCAPLLVQFTDLSTGSPTSWNWVFGNGNTSANPGPVSAIYPNPGTYTVTLTVSNGASTDSETKLAYITVYAKPTADFLLSEDTTCVGQNVLLTDASTINAGGSALTSWSWDYGDGTLQTVATNTTNHTYSSVGLFPISVIVTDLNGCTGAKTKNVFIRNFPNPSFTATPTRGCTAPLLVSFTNTTSTVTGSTFLWRFGDGATSASQNPTHTYNAPGSYNVTLIVTQGGCTDSVKVNNRVVISDIVAGFNTSAATICEGSSVSFTNTSAPASVNTSWDFGDAGAAVTTNANHVYTTAGTYTVTMNATDANGCTGSATNTITVNSFPIVSFTSNVTQGCLVPFNVNFTNTSTGGSTFNWNFGDGNTSASPNPSHTYTAAGTYPVTLTVGNAGGTCSDSLRINNYITITPPVANFTTNPDSGCVSLNVVFTSTSTSTFDPITSYEWTFGNGSATTAVPTTNNTYAASGVFSPRLIVITGLGCRDTFDCANCVKAGTPPNSNFTLADNTICFGQLAQVNETATGETGYKWLFGDNGTSLLANPTHNYADTGTFQIQLVAFNNGCSDTSAIQTIRVDGPKASMTRTMSCTDYYDVIFNSTSVMADSVTWDFGDGIQDLTNTTSLTHVYGTRGVKTVTLIANNFTTGCADTTTLNIRITEPIAAFTTIASNGCYPFTATFNSSTSQDASTYAWNFGDPSTALDVSTAANPSYTYTVPGANQVQLIIRDVNGCRDTIVNPLATLGPLVGFESNILTGCSPLPVTFTDTSIVTSPITSWTWDFGDGNTVTNAVGTATHTYTTPGNYAVTLTVTDNTGCTQSKTEVGFIQPTFPFPALAVDTFACANELVTFNANATNAVGEQYIWNFGDGTIDTTLTATTTHAYNADNLYTITLTVEDANGCDSTITRTIRILKPTANFSINIINSGCGTLQASFADLSTGFVNAWNWNFGNGSTSALQNPIFTWTQAGTFDVSLIVTNTGGCKDTLTQTGLAVVPGPVGTYTFTPDSGCNPLTVTFNASSLNSENYFWDLADGTVITGVDSLTYTYNFEGTYNPVLVLSTTMTNGQPCLLPATNLADSIQVINLIDITLSSNSLSLIEDSTAIVNATTTGGASPYTYSWTPTDNMNCSTCADVTFTGDGSSEIKYYVTATDLNGCKGLDSVLVISTPCVNAESIPNYFSPNGDDINDVFYIPGVCAGENYIFQIFNRWGNLMFTSSLRKQVWDGRTTSGMQAPDGTYYFILEVSGVTYKGFVQLTR